MERRKELKRGGRISGLFVVVRPGRPCTRSKPQVAWKRGKVKRGQEGPDAKEAVLTQREVTRTEWGGVVTPEAGSGSGHVVGVKDSIHVSRSQLGSSDGLDTVPGG